ncbi:MAG: DUF169 domain-containing protein [Candidatus Manganitrophus sp.]|nr:DUF169 domain-containing protein [Candidatus Manganitrophus sp.]
MAPVEAVPEGIPVFEGVSPSSCAFWRQAEKELFAANDADHMNCPIGAMVMGFELTSEAKEGLQRGLSMMCEVGYVKPEEAAADSGVGEEGKGDVVRAAFEFPGCAGGGGDLASAGPGDAPAGGDRGCRVEERCLLQDLRPARLRGAGGRLSRGAGLSLVRLQRHADLHRR